jgi:hypothetical protein
MIGMSLKLKAFLAKLRADTHPVYTRTHCAVVSRPAFNIERAGFACGTIRIKRVAIGLLVVPITGESASRTNTQNLTA